LVRYVFRRLLGAVFVVWVISVVTFSLFALANIVSGSSPAYLYVGKTSTPAQVAAVEESLGLNKPYVVQYWEYIKAIFVGRPLTDGVNGDVYCNAPCFGYSFQLKTSVWELIQDRFGATLSLAVGAAILWLIVGLAIGIVSALKRGSFLDRFGMIFALAGVSLPVYFTGLLLLYAFSFGPEAIRWFPDTTFVPLSQGIGPWARALTLAWISLAFLYAALYARFTRTNLLETMGEDYIRTATAKGLPRRTVVGKHALRAALTPLITIFGLDLAGLLGGAILTEKTFTIPGLGALAVDAIGKQDLPVIMGVTIVGAIFIVIANVIVDVLYAYVDPRVAYS